MKLYFDDLFMPIKNSFFGILTCCAFQGPMIISGSHFTKKKEHFSEDNPQIVSNIENNINQRSIYGIRKQNKVFQSTDIEYSDVVRLACPSK